MKTTPVRGVLLVGAFCAFALGAVQAQVVRLNATINAAQEVPATSSPAAGTAVMLYYPATNTFDLVVSITGMTNTPTLSHIHEAPAGSNGPALTDLGVALYVRNGNNLNATFTNFPYRGDPVKLLQSGEYYNIHSAQFPGGEIRGQLIAEPVRLYANLDVAQEQAAFPNVNLSALNDFGGALITYNPATNRVSMRTSVYNFRNTMNNSHFHEAPPGESRGVSQNLGPNPDGVAGSAPNQLATYSNTSGAILGSYEGTYGGSPIALLTGGAYLNFHSTTFTGGEVRGQVYFSNEAPSSRMLNTALRGFVGTGDQVLIGGIVVAGPEPVRVLITAKGAPSLAAFNVTGGVANPRLAIFDSGGRQIAQNDDIGTPAAGSELATMAGVPRNAVESALLLVLPPGSYTAQVSAATGTGIALLEVTDVRSTAIVSPITSLNAISAKAASMAVTSAPSASAAAKGAVELCIAPIVAVAVK